MGSQLVGIVLHCFCVTVGVQLELLLILFVSDNLRRACKYHTLCIVLPLVAKSYETRLELDRNPYFFNKAKYDKEMFENLIKSFHEGTRVNLSRALCFSAGVT